MNMLSQKRLVDRLMEAYVSWREVPSRERGVWLLGEGDGPRCYVRVQLVYSGARPGGASR